MVYIGLSDDKKIQELAKTMMGLYSWAVAHASASVILRCQAGWKQRWGRAKDWISYKYRLLLMRDPAATHLKLKANTGAALRLGGRRGPTENWIKTFYRQSPWIDPWSHRISWAVTQSSRSMRRSSAQKLFQVACFIRWLWRSATVVPTHTPGQLS